MLTLSPMIALSKKQNKIYRIAQVFLALAAIVALYLLIASIVLPQVKLSYNVRNTDPLYDLSSPQTINGTTTFSGSLAQDVDQIHINIKLPQGAKLTSPILTVKKGYRAFLQNNLTDSPYPETTSSTNTPFSAGDLIRSSTEYFVVDRDTLLPVASSEALLAAGFSFESAIDSTSQERSLYQRGDRFDMRSDHPSGTYFYDDKTNQHYRLAENALHQVSPPQNKKTSVVRADTASIEKKDVCTLKKALFTNTYKCSIILQNTKELRGKDYVFTLDDKARDFTSIQTTFFASPTTKNLQSRLGLIKQKISQ